ncbi:hypothetical protein [Kocuria sp. CPCC 205261]|uniref:hypothetical protein n=1 Tax=Kocuria sp. CPCC 205261 TaxID=3073554 RepID=UPI0034D4A5B6
MPDHVTRQAENAPDDSSAPSAPKQIWFAAASGVCAAVIISLIGALSAFQPGDFWGIKAEHWVAFWGSVLGAVLSAAVAVIILWRQTRAQALQAADDRREQAEIARLDREHQAEVARQSREIDAVSQLHGAIQNFLDAQNDFFENGTWWDGKTHETRPTALMTQVEISAHKWSLSTGVDAKISSSVANALVQCCLGYVYRDDYGNKMCFHDYQLHLIGSIGEVMRASNSAVDEKLNVFNRIHTYYRRELEPRHQERIRTFQSVRDGAGPDQKPRDQAMYVKFWPHRSEQRSSQ